MDNFKIIYKILKSIEHSMDYDEFDVNCISSETLMISYQRWNAIIVQLVKSGYIEGISLIRISGKYQEQVKILRPMLTIKGLEYLEENMVMKKVANTLKGIIDVVK
ncbi:MAG: YjcQ family protein [Clostridioides sp.]|nr:YjcQ family protein [Clostridioides sp.]